MSIHGNVPIDALMVHAYAVDACFDGKHFQEMPGGVAIRKPKEFIHYWIDECLQYHESLKDTAETPRLIFIQRNGLEVKLKSRGRFTINRTQ